jgi:hypothetical protein
MASLIQGYEYDICLRQGYGRRVIISYRQKDNKYEGWVTEFVRAFKTALNNS